MDDCIGLMSELKVKRGVYVYIYIYTIHTQTGRKRFDYTTSAKEYDK